MGKVFAILGSGMQGTACAYDIAKHGEPEKILLGDINLEQASTSAKRINELVGHEIAFPVKVDATNIAELENFMQPVDVLVSSVPYHMHGNIAPVAIRTKTSMVDMGGNTDVALHVLANDKLAKESKVTIVPDTGLAPGLVNSLATYCMDQFDKTESIQLYCGGLPQNPKPPFNYKLVFNIEGVTTEYNGEAVILRDGKVGLVDALTELEELEFEAPLNKLEAFVTSGGTSTAPYSFEGKLTTYEYKTLRYPGHVEKMKLFKDFGFWNNEEIDVKGRKIIPRELFHTLVGPLLVDKEDKDLVVIRCVAKGTKNGKPVQKQLDIVDRYDTITGFSAMERLTGFTTAIHAEEIAKGNVPAGCHRYELALPGKTVIEGMRKRGIEIKES